MLDARTLPHRAELTAEFCVIGAGPAGLTLALELTKSGGDVLLIEAGPARGTRDDLNPVAKGAAIGSVADITNICAIGGNANAWSVHTPQTARGVRFGRYAGHDFGSDWPVSAAEMDRAYRRAASVWNIDPEGWSVPGPALPLGRDVETAMFQFADARTLTSGVVGALRSSGKAARMLHNAQAQALEFGSEGAVKRVRLATAPGHDVFVRADQYILAGGCMGVTRLMLNARTLAGHAPGDASGWLGRCFMDHPLIDGGLLFPAAPTLFDAAQAFDMRADGQGVRMAHLHLSAEAIAREGIPNLGTLLLPRRASELGIERRSPRRQRAHQAGLAVRQALERRERPRFADLGAALAGSDEVLWRMARLWLQPQFNLGRGGWSKRGRAKSEFAAFQVYHQAEQRPQTANRLYLSPETDALGLRKLFIDWSWSAEDAAACARGQALIANAFSDAGLGRIETRRDEFGAPELVTHSMGHHLGTTRMHADATLGVTDPSGRVHGTSNLSVCSSSLFPCGSYINPTFTILALATRQAAHLTALRRGVAQAA